MELEEKVKAVEALFTNLDKEISDFQAWSTWHCKSGCGKCCVKVDLEASILEFLPFAFYLHKTDQAFLWIEKLKMSSSSICQIFDPSQNGVGLCTEYPHRGLICRLFGYSARMNKYNKPELVTCNIIKTEQAVAYANAVAEVTNGKEVPVMSRYYMKLQSIDFDLTREFYPINTAIFKAIEIVLHYYAYR